MLIDSKADLSTAVPLVITGSFVTFDVVDADGLLLVSYGAP